MAGEGEGSTIPEPAVGLGSPYPDGAQPDIFAQIQKLLGEQSGGTFYDNLANYNKQLGALDFGHIDPSNYLSQLGGLSGLFQGQQTGTNTQYADLLSQLGGLQGMAGEQSGGYQKQLAGLIPQLQGFGQNIGALAQQTSGQLNPIYQQLLATGRGGMDPAFQQYQNTQLGLLNNQRTQSQQQVNDQLASRGLQGSTLAMNELNKVNQQYDQQQQGLASTLGLQSLQRGDSALMNAANVSQGLTSSLSGLYGQGAGIVGQTAGLIGQGAQLGQNNIAQLAGLLGQRGGLLGQQQGGNLAGMQGLAGLFGQGFQGQLGAGQFNQQATDLKGQALQSILQNQSLPIQFLIAAEAARNAGQGGGDSGGGGGKSCTFFCMVLTDLLAERGDLTMEQYVAHAFISPVRSDPNLYCGYRAWADAVADAARNDDALYRRVKNTVRAYVLDAIGEAKSERGRAFGQTIMDLSREYARTA